MEGRSKKTYLEILWLEKRKPDEKNVGFMHGHFWGPKIATKATVMEAPSPLASGQEWV